MEVQDDLDDIIQEFNFDFLDDPSFNLEPVEISRSNLDYKTPVNIMNKELAKYKNKFTVAHLNVRSLPKNFVEFREVINKTSFDVIAVSETWLSKNTPKDRFTLDYFHIFR